MLNFFTMVERAPLWTRLTNRANVVVWALPLPRRGKALLSRVVYRNPPMPVASVLPALGRLDKAGIETIVMGGWGVDALVGEQRREHRDLDLIVDPHDLDSAIAALAPLGFEEWFRDPDPTPYAGHGIEGDVVVLRDKAMRVVDLHPMRLDDLETASSRGEIGGSAVQCVSAELQIEAQSGYSKLWPGDRRHHQANVETARRALESSERQAVA